MENIDADLLELWLNDESFNNWAKQINKNDIAKWEDYFNYNPDHWETGKAGRLLVLGVPFQKIRTEKVEVDKSLDFLIEKLKTSDQRTARMKHVQDSGSNIFKLSRRWLVAASMIGILVLAGISYNHFFSSFESEYFAGYGEQKEISLPDGSIVTLNSNSRLVFNSKSPRNVRLNGEAFFEVKRLPESGEIFQVTTQDLTVTVLGTSFNVNARNDQTKVFLEEGLVELEIVDADDEIIQMKPGDLITYSRKEKKLKENRHNVSVLENASWKDGALIFNETPLGEALFEIEDIYGIHLIIQSDELRKEQITGGVPIRDLKVTLETLSQVYGIRIRSEGQRYFLSRAEE